MAAAIPAPSRERVSQLRRRLLDWFDRNARALPWREGADAYGVLVSEVMLQQTPAARVAPAYVAFLDRFPTPHALARAPLADVLTAWRGLGYNRRALALHLAAQLVVDRHAGEVPVELTALRALPGVGEYTARAVRTFAHGCDDAPVDTNVARVLSRAVAGQPLTPRPLQQLADLLVPAGRGAPWSAALMDLGATCCTARRPDCRRCPLRSLCAWGPAEPGGAAALPDPAARPTAARATRFPGSDRYARGRLLDALRDAPVALVDVAAACGLEQREHARARQLAVALLREGLVVRDGASLRLPSAPAVAEPRFPSSDRRAQRGA